MTEEFDILIIGAGISGAVLAERYASLLNKKVLVIDKRNHVGGNCYDFIDEQGILIPLYGPHFFHTSHEDVWDYVSNFTEWTPYEHRVLSNIDGKLLVPVPVNITTVNNLFNLNLKSEEDMKIWLETHVEKIETAKNSEEAALRKVGRILYELMFKNYTKKQWDVWPAQLDASVMDRIPVRMNFDDRYFTDKYQAMPKEGYTKLFENMLNHPNIVVKLNTDFENFKNKLNGFKKVFFTGRVDSFFRDIFKEKLQYRSLKFEFKKINSEFFQERAQINYPNTEKFTRITEPKHATGQKHDKTTIIYETSCWDGEPYYPVPTQKNKELYEKYKKEAEKLEKKGIYFVGRLAEYKYFNMDQAFKNALDLFKRLNT
jgi:UDP-galactopyranose mutase